MNVTIIDGGTQGLGEAVARRLAEHGATELTACAMCVNVPSAADTIWPEVE